MMEREREDRLAKYGSFRGLTGRRAAGDLLARLDFGDQRGLFASQHIEINIVTKPPKPRSAIKRVSLSMDADMTVRVNNLAFNARSLDPLCLAHLRGVKANPDEILAGGDLLVMRLAAVNAWCCRCCWGAQAGKLGPVLES